MTLDSLDDSLDPFVGVFMLLERFTYGVHRLSEHLSHLVLPSNPDAVMKVPSECAFALLAAKARPSFWSDIATMNGMQPSCWLFERVHRVCARCLSGLLKSGARLA